MDLCSNLFSEMPGLSSCLFKASLKAESALIGRFRTFSLFRSKLFAWWSICKYHAATQNSVKRQTSFSGCSGAVLAVESGNSLQQALQHTLGDARGHENTDERHFHSSFIFLSVNFQLFMSIPVGIGQVYGCDNPWTGGIFIISLFISSPITCIHAVLGSTVGMVSGEYTTPDVEVILSLLDKQHILCLPPYLNSCCHQYAPTDQTSCCFAGLALAAPFGDIYFGLWGYNCVLACIAIGGMFYALTWQVHLLAITCGELKKEAENVPQKMIMLRVITRNLSKDKAGICNLQYVILFAAFFCAYLGSAIANIMSAVSTDCLSHV